MKTIMYKESTSHTDGIASFEYSQRALLSQKQQLLFQLSAPVEELQERLLQAYKGKSIDFESLFKEHSIDKPYVKNNYKMVLKRMLENGTITAVGTEGKMKGTPPIKGSFAEHNIITFPLS